MKKGLIGKKLGMTQVIEESGLRIPVTVIEAGPCTVVQVKTEEVDGYNSIQLGFENLKPQHVRKPIEGHFKKANLKPMKYLKEFRLKNTEEYKVGDVLKVDIFEEGEKVNVQGKTKGKGFAGVIKRHGYGRGPESHGSRFHRRPGSLGASATPSRVFKGTKLPGQMGGNIVTIKNLEIVKVDVDKNVLLVKGSIPGPKGTIVNIKAR